MILFNSLFTGVGQAIQPIVATNYGAHQMERIYIVRSHAVKTILGMGALFTLFGLISPSTVCHIFLPAAEETTRIANYGIRLYFIAFLPMAFNVLASNYLQSILKTKASFTISFLRNVVLSGCFILLLPSIFGGFVLWCIMPIVELIVLCISIRATHHKD